MGCLLFLRAMVKKYGQELFGYEFMMQDSDTRVVRLRQLQTFQVESRDWSIWDWELPANNWTT